MAVSRSPDLPPLAARSRAPYHVGFSQLKLVADPAGRPVWGDVWYPVAPSVPEVPAAYILARGRAARDAPLAPGLPERLPTVLLSHGSGGSAADYPWLTETLASHGFIVLGVHHYGESRAYGERTVDPSAALRFWLRPRDVELAFAKFTDEPRFGPRIDLASVFGVGHSAGGHTILAAAGVRFDPRRAAAYCAGADRAIDKGCAYAAAHHDTAPAPFAGSVVEAGVSVPFSGIVLLDPALGPTYADSDLRALSIPVLLVATRPGDFQPFEPHAGHYAQALPRVELTLLEAGEGHFVFLGECSLGIDVQGTPLCRDASGVDRHQVHQKIAEGVLAFFAGFAHE